MEELVKKNATEAADLTKDIRVINVWLIPNTSIPIGSNVVCSGDNLNKCRQLFPTAMPGAAVQIACGAPGLGRDGRDLDMTNHGWPKAWQQDFRHALAPGWMPDDIAKKVARGYIEYLDTTINGNMYRLVFKGDWSKVGVVLAGYQRELAWERENHPDFRWLTDTELAILEEKDEAWENELRSKLADRQARMAM